MTKCAECGHDISTKASLCPSCGAPRSSEAQLRAQQDPLGLRQPVSKSVWITIAAVVAVVGLLAIAGGNSNSSSDASRKEEATDLTRPIVTRERAIVCPMALLFDKRADGGLKAANEALGTGFGRSEAVQKAGCEEWRANMPIYVQPSEIRSRDGYVHWMEAHQAPDFSDLPILIPDSDVVNPAAPSTRPAGVASPPLTMEPTPKGGGVYAFDYINQPEINAKLRALLGDKYPDLEADATGPANPMRMQGDFWAGDVCRAHFCGSDAIFIAKNVNSDQLVVAVWKDGKRVDVYGVQDSASIPAPVSEWIRQQQASAK